ncbi:MAG: tetratricopeptide repeat protein [Pyrinomonadaceae bacterium]
MARYKKKRARELQHDRFRDTAIGLFDRLGNLLEGKGRLILYGVGGAVVAAALIGAWVMWSRRKTDEARRAMGRAIAIATTPVSASPLPGAAPGFSSEQERARKAIEEFEKVAAKYGDPYRTEARYFVATNQLYVEREKGISELVQLSSSSLADVAVLSKFALAQVKEADAKYDEAAQLYVEIANLNIVIVPADVANFRLGMVYQKQGKTKEAADVFFKIADAARKAKDKDGAPIPLSEAAREATQQLQKLDPDRFTKLPPETPALSL